jgi:hypothetical protein
MIAELSFALTSLIIILITRKISKFRLSKVVYYPYCIIFFLLGVQFFSIALYGVELKGVDVEPEFFNSLFTHFLPNTIIQMTSFLSLCTIYIFCLPKHPKNFPRKNDL